MVATIRKDIWDFPVTIDKDEEYLMEEEKEEAQRKEQLPVLEKFLEDARAQEKAVVYMGFGSMPAEAKKLLHLATEVSRLSGKQVVLCAGWSDVDRDALPSSVCLVSWVPHDSLFPGCECVVHHGGAGTVGMYTLSAIAGNSVTTSCNIAAALRAGVPSVVCPVFADQPYWGQTVKDLGVGATPIPFKELTAERLAEAIDEACKSEVKAKARELAAKLKEEGDGVARTCETIERNAVISIGSVPTQKFAKLSTLQVVYLELSALEKVALGAVLLLAVFLLLYVLQWLLF